MTKAMLRDQIQELEAAKPSYTVLMTSPDGKDLMRTWHIMCAIVLLSPDLRAALADAPDAGECASAIKKHYPMIAGRAIGLRNMGEETAAKHWEAVSKEFYDAMRRCKPAPSESACAKVLREIEWVGIRAFGPFCPSCLMQKPTHAPDCELDAALNGVTNECSSTQSKQTQESAGSDPAAELAARNVESPPRRDGQTGSLAVGDGVESQPPAQRDTFGYCSICSKPFLNASDRIISSEDVSVCANCNTPRATCRWTKYYAHAMTRYKGSCGVGGEDVVRNFCPNCGKPIELAKEGE